MAVMTVVEVTVLQSWNMGSSLYMKLGYDDYMHSYKNV